MSHGRGRKQGQERSPLSLSPFPVILCFPPTLIVFFTLFLTWTLINHSWAPAPAQVPAVPCPHRVPVTSLSSGTRQGCSQDLAHLLPSPSPSQILLSPFPGLGCPSRPRPTGRWGSQCPPCLGGVSGGGDSGTGRLPRLLLCAFGDAVVGGKGLGAGGMRFPELEQGGREKRGTVGTSQVLTGHQGCVRAKGKLRHGWTRSRCASHLGTVTRAPKILE